MFQAMHSKNIVSFELQYEKSTLLIKNPLMGTFVCIHFKNKTKKECHFLPLFTLPVSLNYICPKLCFTASMG
jgi:hypothetical protein